MTMPSDDEPGAIRVDVPQPPGWDDAAVKTPERSISPLDELRDDLAEELTGLDTTYPVPGRPRWAVRYRLDIEGPMLQRWGKQAQDKKLPGGVDAHKVACTVLANQCDAILRVPDAGDDDAEPEPVYGEDGDVLTFRHPELQAMLGVKRAVEAVQAFYGLDGVVIKISGDLVEEAGYGDEMPNLDPTRRR